MEEDEGASTTPATTREAEAAQEDEAGDALDLAMLRSSLACLSRVLDASWWPKVRDAAENLLESRSYLEGTPAPSALDWSLFSAIQAAGGVDACPRGSAPPVQYPSLHRWFEHLCALSLLS